MNAGGLYERHNSANIVVSSLKLQQMKGLLKNPSQRWKELNINLYKGLVDTRSAPLCCFDEAAGPWRFEQAASVASSGRQAMLPEVR